MNESATYEVKLKDAFSSPLKSLETKMNGFEGKVGGLKSSFEGLGSSIAGAFAGGLVAGGIAGLISGLKDITTEIFNTTREFTNLKEAIEFASGSDAATNIKFLDDTINTLGLDINSTYKGFKTFEGALMGTALEGEKGREIFTAVSKAATVMKLSADSTEGAFLALGQMISKGTVSAEELRGQLGERLPGAFQIAARAMGVTTAKLGDMMKKGEVVAEDFLPKFAAELEKTFGPGVQKAQNSFNANWNRFNNFIFRSKLLLGNSLLPALNDIISIIPKLDFTVITYNLKELWGIGSQITDTFKNLFSTLGIGTDTMTGFQLAVQYMGAAMRVALTPLRIIISTFNIAISAIKTAGLELYEFYKLGKNVASGNFGEAFKNITAMKDIGTDFGKQMGDAFNTEVQGWKNIFTMPGQENKGALGAGTGGVTGGLSTAGKTGKADKSGVEKISSGTRNITINITKLVETVNISKTLDRMNNSDIVNAVQRALLTAVNDANIVAQ